MDCTAIIRIEQLYPMKQELLETILAPYAEGTPVVWVQEEPKNMGAWYYIQELFGARLFDKFPLSGVYRKASASPATGSKASHMHEQREVVALALGMAVKVNFDWQ